MMTGIEKTPMPPKRPAAPRNIPVCSFEKACAVIRKKCGGVISERHGSGPHKVMILPEAARELEVMISYGRRSPMNVCEQKYTGYGHFLMDERGNHITVVNHFIEIQTMNRSPVGASNLGPDGENNPGLDFLEYHREEFMRTEAKYNTDAFGYQVDPFLSLCGPSEFVLEGHTHPDLGVFYSGPDRASGSARAGKDPVCIFVCDPIRREMLGSIGKEFLKAEVIVYSRVGCRKKEEEEVIQFVPCADEEEVQPSPCADEGVRLARRCRRNKDYKGEIGCHTRMDGRV
ncbi:MAG: hypothetical protein LUC83_08935, partial [Clostridiales bacterium]|nr:hypothetical protein [Clostridiales bacterium]